MKRGIILAAMMMLVLVSSLAGTQGNDKETRDLKGFNRINFGISGNLFVSFGQQYSVVLEGRKQDLDEVITEISDGRLTIKRENRHFNNMEKIVVHITMPELTALGVSGSGNAEITDAIKDADELDFSVSGSGKLVTAAVTADDLDCSISGSGNILISGDGNADNAEISISGSGNYTGEEFEIDHLNVKVSGSGNCLCKVGDSIEASISGSGNVTYIGTNAKVDARVSGSGKVRSR